MEMNILFQRQALAAFLILLFVLTVATQVFAKDTRAAKRSSTMGVTGWKQGPQDPTKIKLIPQDPIKAKVSPQDPIKINVSPQDPVKIMGPQDPIKGKVSPQDPIRSNVFTPGSESSLNPQPLPPKVQQLR